MTREEARLILQKNLSILSFMLSRRISEAIKAAIEALSQPSLPSNLDEAEFEYAQSLDEIPANQEEEKMIYNAFKAGVEWIVGQGVTTECNVLESNNGLAYFLGTDDARELGILSCPEGTKVIVQIRKKEE